MKRASSRTRDTHFSNLASATEDAALLNQSASSEVLGSVPTVLIIDADPIVRNLLRDILSRNGFMVLDAVSHSEALELLRMLSDEEVDLLITEHSANLRASPLAAELASLRPAVKILFTFRADASPLPLDDTALPGIAFLQHPFTEARLLAAILGLLKPTTQ